MKCELKYIENLPRTIPITDRIVIFGIAIIMASFIVKYLNISVIWWMIGLSIILYFIAWLRCRKPSTDCSPVSVTMESRT